MSASNVGKTALKGHGLRHEGVPVYDDRGQLDTSWEAWSVRSRREGRAKCSCGALSEPGITQAAAKRWHREHKDSLR